MPQISERESKVDEVIVDRSIEKKKRASALDGAAVSTWVLGPLLS